MSVSELLMRPGSWQVKLREETPAEVLQALDWTVTPVAGFGHIFIFSTPVRTEEFSDANLKSLATYAGILREAPDARTIGGPGMVAWLGDEDDKGAILETAVTQAAPATLATWVTALRPASLSAGTVTSTGTSYPTAGPAAFQWVTPRTALGAVCAAVGAEYRVNPDGTLDAATAATLFGSTPTGFVTRRTEGREDYLGILAAQLETARDLDDYTTKVRAIAKTGLGTASGAATPYKDINGNAVVLTRVIETPESDDGNAAATALVNKFSTTRKGLRLTSSTFAIPTTIEVGASVYVYDPRSGLVDTANQIQFGGELTFPVSLRVYGYTWPIREGMGVAFRDGNAVWTDLTPWVAWETGDTTIDVGGYARILGGDPSYIGTPAITPAVEVGGWTSYTPTLTQSGTVTNTVSYARYRLNGSTVTVEVWLAVTGAGSAGVGISVSLPIAAVNSGNMAIKSGHFAVHDASASQVYTGAPTVSPSTTIYGLANNNGAAAIGQSPSFALASGDSVSFSVSYEAAIT